MAGLLILASISCKREESAAPDKTSSAVAKASGSAGHASAGSPEEKAESLPTKTNERPSTPEKKIWVAEPVADRPGYVKSPFSGKIIDVKGIPAGRLVADPTFPASEMKHFRVPEMPEDSEEELKRNAPVAAVVSGNDNFIVSPYDNKIIDARGIAPGTVIQDPTAPAGEKRYIKIPGGLPPEMDSIDYVRPPDE